MHDRDQLMDEVAQDEKYSEERSSSAFAERSAPLNFEYPEGYGPNRADHEALDGESRRILAGGE